MKKLTINQIQQVFKRKDLDITFCNELARLLDYYATTFNVDTPIRRVRFLAQAVHEVFINSHGKVRMRENLNYSDKGLIKISKFFRSHKKLAMKYGRNKYHKANIEAIANLMYADKNRSKSRRLGNIKQGDGYLFRGAGIFQSTGRENISKDLKYIEVKTGIKLLNKGKPFNGILSTYTVGILLGLAYWHRNKLYKPNDTNSITNKINSGLPTEKKKDRLATAIRIKNILV